MWKPLLLLIPLSLCLKSYAQKSSTDTIPFTIQNRLLVFSGKLNGRDAKFAFDTGAEQGVGNTKNLATGGVESTGRSIRVSDANLQNARLENGKITELRIGSFSFKNVKCLIKDAPFLYCGELFLLGSDIIRQMNWNIDFRRQLIYVSSDPFQLPDNPLLVSLPVKYVRNKPMTAITIGQQEYKNAEIDFGLTTKLTLPLSDKGIRNLAEDNARQGKLNYSLATAMTLIGTPQADTVRTIILDSILLGGHYFQRVTATSRQNTALKLGLGFFTDYCSSVIINNTTATYALLPAKEVPPPTGRYEILIDLKDGKLKVTGKNLMPNSVGNSFDVGEEIAAVDGRTASSFKSECDFFEWYTVKEETLTVIKLDGQSFKIDKIKLL